MAAMFASARAKGLHGACSLLLVAVAACANRGTAGSATRSGPDDSGVGPSGGDATVGEGPDGAGLESGVDASVQRIDAGDAGGASNHCPDGGQDSGATGIDC